MGNLLRCEWQKIKHLNILSGALMLVVLNGVVSFVLYQAVGKNIGDYSQWNAWAAVTASTFWGMLFPLFSVYLGITYSKLEYEQKGMQWLLCMPYKKSEVYIAKRLMLFIVGALTCFLYALTYLGLGLVLNLGGTVSAEFFVRLLFSYLCGYLMTLISYTVMEYSQSLLFGVSVGMAMVIGAFILAQSRYYLYCPLSYPAVIVQLPGSEAVKLLGISVLVSVLILIITCRRFIAREQL